MLDASQDYQLKPTKARGFGLALLFLPADGPDRDQTQRSVTLAARIVICSATSSLRDVSKSE